MVIHTLQHHPPPLRREQDQAHQPANDSIRGVAFLFVQNSALKLQVLIAIRLTFLPE
jgi:hypothetical protein